MFTLTHGQFPPIQTRKGNAHCSRVEDKISISGMAMQGTKEKNMPGGRPGSEHKLVSPPNAFGMTGMIESPFL